MRITDRNKKLLIILSGVVIFIALFFGVYSPLAEAVRQNHEAIAQLRPRMDTLEEYNRNLTLYKAENQRIWEYIQSETATYPAYIREEDFLLWILGLEDFVGYDLNMVAFSSASLLMEFPCYVAENGQQVYTDMYAYRTATQTSGSLTYQQLKDALDYTYATTEPTAVEMVTISYDATTGQLSTAISLSKLFLQYQEAEYVPVPIPDVPLGVTNPFGG